MTRKEVIEILKSVRVWTTRDEVEEALDMAISSLEIEPCNDCISRAEVLDLCDSTDPNYEIRHLKEDVECLSSVYVYPKSEGLDDTTLDNLWDEAITLYDKEGQPYSCVLTNTLNNYNRKWHKGDKPKTGHWIEHEHNGIVHIECSECSSWFLKPHLLRNSYCPNCGAKMVEPQESEVGDDTD